jgi:hypothetical protein
MNMENNKKEISSLSYTKAGLLNKSKKESGGKDKGESNVPEKTDISEHTPTISKEKSTERDNGRPIR